ncbi:MAG: hypothetical protein L0323_01110 [Planctomycetes bacterium]|nr:hypothetical protein [Planctomycetota bacterium]
MTTVVLSAHNVAGFPEGGGHFWVYLQYLLGLRQAGCDVYWLEHLKHKRDRSKDPVILSTFLERAQRFGFEGKFILYCGGEEEGGGGGPLEFLHPTAPEAEEVFRRADLLLNFHYAIDPALFARFRRTALVDIDPGLLQLWISTGQLRVPRHDLAFTIGETVGTPTATFPDCGLDWIHIRPPVCLDWWPYVHDPGAPRFTTVAGWWSGKWVREKANGKEVLWENTKRVAFLDFADLPRRTSQPLELAVYLADGDGEERRSYEGRGWHIRHSREVARTPDMYRTYIQGSRGEFSCAKPSTIRSQNAWVSDRTVCYLASGKPAVVQHTGRSTFLPNGEGMFRFSTIEEAASALESVNADYERHCRAARALAETYFDARKIVGTILGAGLA